MVKLKTLFTAILMTATSWAGGDLVNNGGGLAEKNVYYAYKNLESYIKACLGSDVCKVTDAQKTVLTKILNGLPQEAANASQISFGSEKKVPGSFMIDGQVRVAKTGNAVASSILINTDLLYAKDGQGLFEAMSIPEAVAVLVHEMGHHYGNYTHDELDLIGVSVSLYLERTLITTPMIPWESDISATVYNPSNLTAFPELLLYVGNDIVDLSDVYKKTVQCTVLSIPIPILPIQDIALIQDAPLGSMLFNVHWEKIKESEGGIDIEIAGNISNMCRLKSEGKIRNNSYKFSLKFSVVKKNDVWVYRSNSTDMSQFTSPWYKFIKLP